MDLLRKTLKRAVLLSAIAAVNALLTIVTESEKVAAVVLGGIVVAASRRVPPTKNWSRGYYGPKGIAQAGL